MTTEVFRQFCDAQNLLVERFGLVLLHRSSLVWRRSTPLPVQSCALSDMGSSASRNRSRPRPTEQPPQSFAYPPPQQVQGPPQVSSHPVLHSLSAFASLLYPLHLLAQAQEPVLYGPQSINNGQMYGGWRPPYQQQNFVVRLVRWLLLLQPERASDVCKLLCSHLLTRLRQ